MAFWAGLLDGEQTYPRLCLAKLNVAWRLISHVTSVKNNRWPAKVKCSWIITKVDSLIESNTVLFIISCKPCLRGLTVDCTSQLYGDWTTVMLTKLSEVPINIKQSYTSVSGLAFKTSLSRYTYCHQADMNGVVEKRNIASSKFPVFLSCRKYRNPSRHEVPKRRLLGTYPQSCLYFRAF